MLDRVLITLGIVLLTSGIVLFGKMALSGDGNLLVVFGLIMSSLLFFNLPTVRARRRDRRQCKEKGAN